MIELGDIMEFDLIRLNNGIDSKVIVNNDYTFTSEQLEGSGITSIDNMHVEGEITLNALKELYLSLEVHANLVIPCALTLVPVDYPIDIVIEGDLDEIYGDLEKNNEKCLNSIDILPIIWENILMEVPLRVVADGADITGLSGDGWRVITDEEENINSELSKLEELLQDSEVK